MKKDQLHFLGGQNFSTHRGLFLDGTWTAYFGAGQMPNIISNTYYVPTDWNKVKTLMRPPQVVWLEVRINWSQSHDFWNYSNTGPTTGLTMTPYTATFDPLMAGMIGNVMINYEIDPTATVILADYIYDVQTNLAMVEKVRLNEVFADVKATIEALRPGRTWVGITNWYDDDASTKGLGFNSGTIEIGTDPTWADNGSWFLEFPDAEFPRLDYFGTDFLGVYCGNAFKTGHTSANPWSLPFGSDTPESDLVASSQWANIYVDRMKPNYKKFYRHSTQLFHTDVPWGHWQDFIGRPGTILPDVIYTFSELNAQPFNLIGGDIWLASGISDASSTDLDSDHGEVFDAVASIAATDHIDIAHPGGTSLITFDYLIDLIATHFGFDKDTGIDVP